jgi:hypothetical protein
MGGRGDALGIWVCRERGGVKAEGEICLEYSRLGRSTRLYCIILEYLQNSTSVKICSPYESHGLLP